jgi:tripartite-type tricarboxylate transporter receptor subunit TctC
MPVPRRRFLRLATGAVALPALSRAAMAETYPSRPITLIVPFPPGGLADLIARLITEGMRARLGQSLIIENVGGATGSIGTGRVARAPPDGHTLVLGIWNTHVANGATYSLSYDVVKDFEPVVLLADAPLVMVVKKAMAANTLQEFITWLRANPNQASFATIGAGSPGHLLDLLFEKETGARLGQVAYRGAGPAIQDVVGGQIDGMFANTATSMPHVLAGSVKAFAITAVKRLPLLPDVPSVSEAGLPSLRFSLWAAIFAPKGTPRPIIDKLNAAAVATLSEPAIREKLVAQGFEIPTAAQQTPEALAAYQKAEIDRWWPIIKAADVKAE